MARNIPWEETLTVSDIPLELEDVHDDLKRCVSPLVVILSCCISFRLCSREVVLTNTSRLIVIFPLTVVELAWKG